MESEGGRKRWRTRGVIREEGRKGERERGSGEGVRE